jgi:hypothetical protein
MESWKDRLKGRFADGWIPLLDVEDGWRELILGLVSSLDALGVPWKAHQIKQKMGGLRFYADPLDCEPERRVTFRAVIRVAEDRSWRICERCGAEGTTAGFGVAGMHVRTFCERCAEHPHLPASKK